MNATGTTTTPTATPRSELGFRAALLMLGAAGVYTIYSGFLALTLGGWQLYAHFAVMVLYCAASIYAGVTSRRGHPGRAVRALVAALLVTIMAITLLIADIGLAMAAIGFTLTSALALLLLEPGTLGRFFVISLAVGYTAILLDIYGPLDYRYKLPALEIAAPLIAGMLLLLYIIYIGRSFNDLSVRIKLVSTFIGLAAITIALVGVVTNQIVTTELRSQVSAQLDDLAASKALEIGGGIERNINIMQTLAVNRVLQDGADRSSSEDLLGIDEIEALDIRWRAADAAGDDSVELVRAVLDNPLSEELKEFQARFPEHAEIFVTNRFGLNIASTNRTSDYYQADEDWWLAAFNNGVGGIYVGQPEFDESANTYSINIAVPIPAQDRQEIVGILRTTLDLAIIQDLLEAVEVQEAGEVDVVFNNGPIEGMFLHHDTVEGFDTLASESLDNLAAVGATAGEAVYEGVPSLVSQAPVAVRGPEWSRLFEELGWTVVAHAGLEEALAPITGTTRTTILISMGVLVIASMVGYVVANQVTAPISDLTAVAEKVRGGDFSTLVRVRTRDEIGTLGASFNNMITQLRGLIGNLEELIAERTKALQTSTEVSRRLSTILDERELVLEVVEQVRSAFDYYHAHIYLFDEREENLVMVGGTGDVGRQMLTQGHSLPRGRGLVGRAAELNAPVLVPDVHEDEDWLPNPLLPDTQSELAVPIAVGPRVLGVIDIQDDERGGLDEQDAELIQSISNQVAIGLQNARSYGDTQREARREAMINEITQEIQRTTSVESALQVAVRELGRVLGARRASVELHSPPAVDETNGADH